MSIGSILAPYLVWKKTKKHLNIYQFFHAGYGAVGVAKGICDATGSVAGLPVSIESHGNASAAGRKQRSANVIFNSVNRWHLKKNN